MNFPFLSLFFFWSSIFAPLINISDLVPKTALIPFYDAYCNDLNVGATSGRFNFSLWSLETLQTSEVFCSAGVIIGMVDTRVSFNLFLDPSVFSLQRVVNETSGEVSFLFDRCKVNVNVYNVHLTKPDPLIELLLDVAKKFFLAEFEPYLCKVALPFFQQELRNESVNLPAPVPGLAKKATPLSDAIFVQAALRALKFLGNTGSVQLAATVINETTFRLNVSILRDINVDWKNKKVDFQDVEVLSSGLSTSFAGVFFGNFFKNNLSNFFFVNDPEVSAKTVSPFQISLDLSFNDLHCDSRGSHCSLPCTDGIFLRNLRLKGLKEWDRLVVNYAGPLVSSYINSDINSRTKSFCSVADNRFFFPPSKVPPVSTEPSVLLYYCFIPFVVLFSVGVIVLNVKRHKKAPLMLSDGSFISLRRVIIEDVIFVVLFEATIFTLLWSNLSSAATLVLGDEMVVSVFSLMETTRGIYMSGSKAFALLVFVFSGIYPYVKLLSIFICIIVLQKPELVLLRVIDFVGKYSLLDSFAMVVMSSGLLIDGIVKVKIYPGFNMFLLGTILLMLLGNYASFFWRRKTSIRNINFQMDKSFMNEDVSFLLHADIEDDTQKCVLEQKVFRNSKTIWFLYLSRIVVFSACILPAWVLPSVSYHVTGAITFMQSADRDMTLFQLASVSLPLFITCVLTVGLIPLLYMILFPRCPALASWCAIDVFFLACFCGYFEIERLILFTVGDIDAYYRVNLSFRWPLLLLLFSCVLQWAFSAEHIFGIFARVNIYWARRTAVTEPAMAN